MIKRLSIILFLLALLLPSCTKVPVTNRRQMKLLPGSTLNSMALTEYRNFLSSHTLSSNASQKEMVTRVGTNVKKAAEKLFNATGKSKLLAGYSWEFNLVEENTVNAWCMPGGKVVVYSGLLPVTQNEDALAVVMGHEIAHALANHGNERMSQGLLTEMGGIALSVALSSRPEQTRDLFLSAYGVSAALGVLLPYSRLHESEADEIGLILMAIAGYNPEEAVPFWQRMEKSGGARPPEFLSTHPNPQNRAEKLKELIPKAKEFARKYGL